MNAPFLLFDDGDISAFESLDALSAYVESPDLSGYVATDSTGQFVKLTSRSGAAKGTGLFISVEKVSATAQNDRMHESEFKERLRTFLRRFLIDTHGTETMEALTARLIARIGYTR